jgi:hypothetical protein
MFGNRQGYSISKSTVIKDPIECLYLYDVTKQYDSTNWGGGQLDLKLKKVYVLCICKYMHTYIQYLPNKMAVLETLTSLHDAKVMVKVTFERWLL